MALLVLLAAAAGTWIVASDLGAADHLLRPVRPVRSLGIFPAPSCETPVAVATHHILIASCALRLAAWIAVITTTFAMSSALEPRETSFAGLESPCRMAPTAVQPPKRSASL